MRDSCVARGLKQLYSSSSSLELERCKAWSGHHCQPPLVHPQRGPSRERNLGPWCKGRWGKLMSLRTWSIWDQKAWDILFWYRLSSWIHVTDTFSYTQGHHILPCPDVVATLEFASVNISPPSLGKQSQDQQFQVFATTEPEKCIHSH